jgi:hypothetical protein
MSVEGKLQHIDPPPQKKNGGVVSKKKWKVSRTLKFKDVFKDFALQFTIF